MGAKPGQVWTADDIISAIRGLAGDGQFPAHLVDGDIRETDSVESLGIDSIGGVHLIDRLEEMTGLSLPDDFVPPGTDISGIAARLNQIAGSS
jgi:acyl carrier protein